jgi:hypothetical protein
MKNSVQTRGFARLQPRPHRDRFLAFSLTLALAGSLQADPVTLTVSDNVPDGDNGSGTRALTTTAGFVSAPAVLPVMTYAVTGLDFSSVGGTTDETVTFTVTYTQTGGTGVQFNGFGNVSVTGGIDFQVDPGETLTATVAVSSTSFTAGCVNARLTSILIGGTAATGESWDLITDKGTIAAGSPDSIYALPLTSFVTIANVVGTANIQRLIIEINAGTDDAVLEDVNVTLFEKTPNGSPGPGSGARGLTVSDGIVIAPPLLPATTYAITGLDLTCAGGTSSESITLDVTYSQTGGTGVQFNGFGNVSVTGGNDNQVENGESLTATVSISGTSFAAGTVEAKFVTIAIGGASAGETWQVVHEGGSVPGAGPTQVYDIPATSFMTLGSIGGAGTVNIQAFTVEITFSPPSTGAGDPPVATAISRSGSTVTVLFSGTDGQSYGLNKSTTMDFSTPDIVDSVTLSGTTGALEDTSATEGEAYYRVEEQ